MSPQQVAIARPAGATAPEGTPHATHPHDARRLAAVVRTQQEIAAGGLDLDAVMALIARRATELTGAVIAGIGVVEGDSVIYRTSTSKEHPPGGIRVPLDGSLTGLCVRSGQTMRCADYQADSRVKHPALGNSDNRSAVVVPLESDGQAVGVLCALAPQLNAFSDGDVETLELIAGLAARALAQVAESDALHASEERFRAAFDGAAVGMATSTLEGRYELVNQAFCEITGRSREELRATTFHAITHPSDVEACAQQVQGLIQGHAPSYRITKRYIRKSGQIVWTENSISLIRDAQGNPLNLILLVQDVTEQMRAERALGESERLARATVDSLGTHIAILDDAGTILSVNRAWHDFAESNGHCDGASVGTNYLAVCDAASGAGSEGAGAAAAGIRDVIARARQQFYMEYPCHSPQEQRWFAMRVTRFAGDGPTRLVVAHENVTARKRAEALERERMGLKSAVTGMQHVLGVVGHELRTPLAGLRAMSEYLLSEEARKTGEWEVFMRNMHDEVLRMSDTVDNLLEAARLNSGQARWNWGEFALADVCEQAVSPVRATIDATRVSLLCDVRPKEARMKGDAGGIRRLITNLVSNARKHTTSGSIAVIVRLIDGNDGQWVELKVRDTGEGIPSDVISRLGEAFALNSGVVGANHVSGTGLGLAICKGVVAAHGGTLSVESAEGRGTTVSVRLRADLTSAATTSTQRPAPGLVSSGNGISSGEAR